MAEPITFSLDLEDHRARRDGPPRYADSTRRLLDVLEGKAVRGTIFVVGDVAADEPQLIRDIAARGHEIAFHSLHHRPLTAEHAARFRAETVCGRRLLEDLTGRPVRGYRAPVFSLTAATSWVVPVLEELDFAYSSSVLPAAHPLYGYAGLPRQPFRWPGGLLELPVPLAQFGPWHLPYLGGVYLRYLPLAAIRWLHQRAPAGQLAWTYCHPYDFDAAEPFTPIRDAPLWVSLLLWCKRRGTLEKLNAVLEMGTAPPFLERCERGDFDAVPRLPAAV